MLHRSGFKAKGSAGGRGGGGGRGREEWRRGMRTKEKKRGPATRPLWGNRSLLLEAVSQAARAAGTGV